MVEDEAVTTSAEATITDAATADAASPPDGDHATGNAASPPDGDHAKGNLANSPGGLDTVGSRVREERLRQRIGLRELARRVGVSASLISQVELGKASPSVGTLYAIVNELGLSLDELFFRETPGRGDRSRSAANEAEPEPARRQPDHLAPASAGPASDHAQQWDVDAPVGGVEPVLRHGRGKVIQLATGVRWERLAPPTPQDVDFLEVAYQPGSESCPPDSLMRHSGHEYGHIISGRMGVTIGFETYELGPGDSVAFDSTMPHRLFAIGNETVEAIWVVVGRRGDGRPGH